MLPTGNMSGHGSNNPNEPPQGTSRVHIDLHDNYPHDVFDPNTGELKQFEQTSEGTTRAEDDHQQTEQSAQNETQEEMAQRIFEEDHKLLTEEVSDSVTDADLFEYLDE
uniref:Uncharacterized protein n=1 Tax=Panagrolaimus sp. JU765 TaxID=591449 RepID=A0AC34RNL9_9BILA